MKNMIVEIISLKISN